MTIFERIANKEIPADIILEDSDFIAFKDIAPKAKIHVLVIPKKCYESFEELPPEVMAKMSNFIKQVTKKLGINKSGYRMVTNVGEDGNQEVKHIHFHILGGEKLSF